MRYSVKSQRLAAVGVKRARQRSSDGDDGSASPPDKRAPRKFSLTPQDVTLVYRMLLGRRPESIDAIAFHIESSPDVEALAESLITSSEFIDGRGMGTVGFALTKLVFAPPLRVDHVVSPQRQTEMLDRIRRQWTRLGEEDPHWSVLSSDDFRADTIDAGGIERLRASGLDWAAMVDLFAARSGRSAGSGVCLELGCGVGRVTRHLADRFERVIGVDISPGNLALCRDYMGEAGIDNVDLVQVSGIEDFEALPTFDYFYSFIVLQHNPPPIQMAMLRLMFERLNPGGGVLFQIPTSMPDYEFDADAYLDSPHGEMEMHGLPRHVILAEMQAHGIEIVDVVPDAFSGGLGSFTFYGIKHAPAIPIAPIAVAPPPSPPKPSLAAHPFGGRIGRTMRRLGLRRKPA